MPKLNLTLATFKTLFMLPLRTLRTLRAGAMVGGLLAALVLTLALAPGPAKAACPIDDPTCGNGGGTNTITHLTVSIPSQGVITDDNGGINCGNGSTDCTQSYTFTDLEGPPTVVLTASGGPSGYDPSWSGCSSVTNKQCNVVMDANHSVGMTWVDVTDPTVALTSPANGATVGTPLQVAATANDNSGIVTKVEFRVDGMLVATDSSAPFDQSISMASYASGSTHTVSARAFDGVGRQSSLSSSTITVDLTNPTATGQPTGKRVPSRANVVATFSEAMNEASVENPGSFTLKKKGATRPVAATVVYSVTTTPAGTTYKAILNPTRNLKAGATYTAKVTSDAKDLAGNPMEPKVWKFTVKP